VRYELILKNLLYIKQIMWHNQMAAFK